MRKRDRKRLNLNAETLRSLSMHQLRVVVGGIVCTDTCNVCDTMDITDCTTSTTTF